MKIKVGSWVVQLGRTFIPIDLGVDKIFLTEEEADKIAFDINAELREIDRERGNG